MIQTATIQITPEILAIVASIEEFKGAWRALGTLAPDRLSALLRVATIESIGSSTRIEGSKLSDREVESLLSNLQIQKFSTRDEQEVAGYAKVMEMVFTSWPDIALTENHIQQLHRDLLIHSEKDAWHRGHYKTSTNSVVAFDENGKQLGIVFETAAPFDTPRLSGRFLSMSQENRFRRQLRRPIWQQNSRARNLGIVFRAPKQIYCMPWAWVLGVRRRQGASSAIAAMHLLPGDSMPSISTQRRFKPLQTCRRSQITPLAICFRRPATYGNRTTARLQSWFATTT